MRNPLDSLAATLVCGILLTAVLHVIVRALAA